VHLHGAKAAPECDGYPDDWYAPGKSVTYNYPNQQEAALLWYHDHAMGINRLNVYAGMLGLYVVRDQIEDGLNLPQGTFEIPLVLTDRFIRQDGQLYYPVSQRPEAPWIAELFGNAVLVNGKLLPYLEVEARKYRFRILNGSNARFFTLALKNRQAMHQIGSDQGLLAARVEIRRLTLAPGERADVVLDFADHLGEQIVLQDGAMPLMQIRVASEKATDTSSLPANLRALERIPEAAAVRQRELTLVELDNVLDEPMTHLLNGARWHEPVTEKPVLGTTEIWSFVNTTEDTHPMHLHLVRFQVLDRKPFDVEHFLLTKEIRYVGKAYAPEANEMGWKDTVRATPASVTRIIAKFDGYAGKYVWHCHILEHEDNELMRPYEVVEA
jgi:spore coat protein A